MKIVLLVFSLVQNKSFASTVVSFVNVINRLRQELCACVCVCTCVCYPYVDLTAFCTAVRD